MKMQKPFLESVEAYPLWRLMAYVFLFALSERLIVTLIFFLRWGFHAVSGIELWFYYGVAKSTFDLYSTWDPTWWILKTLGLLFQGDALFYSVCFVSSLGSSFNAALFCLFVSKLHDKKAGFLAGLIYGSMVIPMWNSAATITHDTFAYPYLILSLLGALMYCRSKGPVKLVYAGLCLLSVFIGIHVGPIILVGAAAVSTFLLWECVRAVIGREARDGYAAFALFLVVVIGAAVLIHFRAMPALMQKIFDLAKETRSVDVRAQIKAGAGDLLATTVGDYWLRLNFLLFFLPVGLYVAFKKRDMLGWGLIVAGILASLAADRGVRPLSFGAALMVALALTNWKTRYCWALGACLVFFTGLLGGQYYLENAFAFPVAALLIYCFIQWPPRGERPVGNVTVILLSLLWLITGYVLEDIARKAGTDGNGVLRGPLKNIWTVRTCVLVPVGLLLLDAWMRRTKDVHGRRRIGYALDKVAYGGLAAAVIALLIWKPGAAWNYLYLVLSPLVAIAILFVVWPRRREENRKYLAGVAAVCWLFAIIITSINLTPRSTEGEYRLYRWLAEHEPAGGKILTHWWDGYLAEALSGHPAEISPHNVDFELPRVYWLTEEEAVRVLRERGVEYIVVSSQYFKLLDHNSETGEFRYILSHEVPVAPKDVGVRKLDQLEGTALFKLLYRPRQLKRFRLLRWQRDRAVKTTYFLYKIL